MVELFGSSHALIGPIQLLFGGASFLLGAMLRKALNDYLDFKFSVIGATGIGCIAFIIASYFLNLKLGILIGICGFLAGGFLFSFIAGESDGGESGGGNYEE